MPVPSFRRSTRILVASACIFGALAVAVGSPILWVDGWVTKLSDSLRGMGEAFSALGALLLALALVGVYVVERSRALLVGLILCLAGIPLVLLWIGVLLVPIGLIVFGIGVARHNRAQRGPGVLLALSVVVGLLAWPILNGLIGHGEYASLVFLALMCPAWLWLGIVLLREPDGTG